MKHIVSVSLGSSKRDKAVEVELLGEGFRIERIGTDGSVQKFAELMRAWDGKADVLCLGGLDLYVFCGGRRYTFRQAAKLAANAKQTPVVDGSGLKNTLERESVRWLQGQGGIDFKAAKVLLVSGVDRFGMAEALRETGCELVFGDLAFGLGINVPIKSWKVFRCLGVLLLPVLTKLPVEWLYPTGEKQEQIVPRFEKLYHWADVIAGDFHFIRRHLPEKLDGKIILTNTTTAEDVELLRQRGVKTLVTTTPEFDGRSFGTNVMEGVIVALLRKHPSELQPEDYLNVLHRLGWNPRVVAFGRDDQDKFAGGDCTPPLQ